MNQETIDKLHKKAPWIEVKERINSFEITNTNHNGKIFLLKKTTFRSGIKIYGQLLTASSGCMKFIDKKGYNYIMQKINNIINDKENDD